MKEKEIKSRKQKKNEQNLQRIELLRQREQQIRKKIF